MLGATDEQTAAVLLWPFLAGSEGEILVHGLTAAQQWAFDVLHQARLTANKAPKPGPGCVYRIEGGVDKPHQESLPIVGVGRDSG